MTKTKENDQLTLNLTAARIVESLRGGELFIADIISLTRTPIEIAREEIKDLIGMGIIIKDNYRVFRLSEKFNNNEIKNSDKEEFYRLKRFNEKARILGTLLKNIQEDFDEMCFRYSDQPSEISDEQISDLEKARSFLLKAWNTL